MPVQPTQDARSDLDAAEQLGEAAGRGPELAALRSQLAALRRRYGAADKGLCRRMLLGAGGGSTGETQGPAAKVEGSAAAPAGPGAGWR